MDRISEKVPGMCYWRQARYCILASFSDDDTSSGYLVLRIVHSSMKPWLFREADLNPALPKASRKYKFSSHRFSFSTFATVCDSGNTLRVSLCPNSVIREYQPKPTSVHSKRHLINRHCQKYIWSLLPGFSDLVCTSYPQDTGRQMSYVRPRRQGRLGYPGLYLRLLRLLRPLRHSLRRVLILL